MIAPRCVGCGRTVLELRGQFARFEAYSITGPEPPPETAGTWHIECLEGADVGPRWHVAVVRSLVDLRRYTLLVSADGWAAVRTPTGEPIAVSPVGAMLPLRFDTPPRAVDGGLVGDLHEPEYNLELDDTVAIERLQAGLRDRGSISLLAVAEALAIADCLVRPDLLTEAAFHLEDPSTIEEWTRRFVCAAVSYSVLIPHALAPFVEE